ncbi:MAG: J domain-containing protein [Dehalococcoidia bacterium]
MAQDYYATLGVKKDAADKEIRKAYRKLARQHHPDVNPGDNAAEERFKRINAAYEVLKDADKRKKYDRWGENWENADQFEAARASGAGRWYAGNGGGGFRIDLDDLEGMGGLGDIFGGVFGRRGRARQRPSVEQAVQISLEEAYNGTARTLQLSEPESCPTCGGTGEVSGAVCHTCGGRGAVERPRRIEVKIPAGSATGSRIRVPGRAGGGDLVLVVTVLPHKRFTRQGDDLEVTVDVPLADALLGGEVPVPTLKGTTVMLKIPQLTQNGRVFRLRGLGMPRLKGEGRGDLLARVNVRLPESLTDEQRAAVAALRPEPAKAKDETP